MKKYLFLFIFLISISLVSAVVYLETKTIFGNSTINYYNVSTQGKAPYLYNYVDNGSFIAFNESKLNQTILAVSVAGSSNTTQEMINAVNGTALNLSNSFGYKWSSLIGRLITSVSSKHFYIVSGELKLNESNFNISINSTNYWNKNENIELENYNITTNKIQAKTFMFNETWGIMKNGTNDIIIGYIGDLI
jgi:hypothetical protein